MPDASDHISRPSHLEIPGRQWILLVCLFLLSLPAVTTRIYSSDEIQYFAYLRSIWFDHDLSFENEYQYFYDHDIGKSDGFHETFLERTTDTGRRINFGTIGCAILWSPFYLAGDVVSRATGAPVDGFSKFYVAAVAYGAAIRVPRPSPPLRAAPRPVGLWPRWRSGSGRLSSSIYVAPPFSRLLGVRGGAVHLCLAAVRDGW